MASTVRVTMGSSPLTRGKQLAEADKRIHHGLIPAHAGKTGRETLGETPSRAHPRSRGENTRSRSGEPAPIGSSPLTRGKP